MSKKQDFNKGYNSQTSICVRRASRLSKADLLSLILEIKNDLGNANWLIHQLLSTGELSEKNMRKGVRFLMCQGYDIAIKDSKPEKTQDKNFSFQEAWQEYKDNNLAKKMCENLIDANMVQKTIEANQKLYQQLNEANEIIKQVAENWTGIAGKQWCPVFSYLEKYNIQYNSKYSELI